MRRSIPCVSTMVPDEPWDDEHCVKCGVELPDTDPDPENTDASPWWNGFCSDECEAKWTDGKVEHEILTRQESDVDGGLLE